MSQQIKKHKPDYSEYSIEEERSNLRKFLNDNNLWIPENFYEHIRSGDVIDIYELPPNRSQLYGNPQFKKLCSYTDEMMKSIPFPKLFWRSDEIQLQLMKKMSHVAITMDQAVPWDIERHELIESMHPNKRTFEIDLGWVGPCFKKDTNERVGFVSSLNVALIFEWAN
ncbi:hypothetical protein K2P97_05880 [bacterium]|nr:hypothetical protein [bacterium]